MKQIEVVAAIIHDEAGRIFATQRGYGDFKDGWEFPGGKMEQGESPEEALRRRAVDTNGGIWLSKLPLNNALLLVSYREWGFDAQRAWGGTMVG